ncbi:LCP family protein [Candidatus Uhrbacteria bacterium]|jgi:polyisoprenyl-teichoic acid--peptidoglycan teichoic acid transferase|nr:LCP family protein [Candidatus Uhrbacteria bacterium]
MEEHSVDFLKKKYDLAPSRKKARRLRSTMKIVGTALGLIAIVGVVFSYNLSSNVETTPNEVEGFSLFSSFRNLVGSDEKGLIGENDDRINLLLLGIGGSGHAGPELTDTIIFSSLQPSTSDVAMLSIPRDLAVPIPGYGYRKINSANAYGELEEKGQGPEWLSTIIEDLLNQEVHYYVKVDFDGFVDLIDAVDGVDVYVETAFTDYTYPTDDYLVKTVSFEQGWTHMDGETALMFSRSRHGTNGEGSDFARAARQQKILLSVKDQVLSTSTLLNPGRLDRVIETFQDNVTTNMSFWEMIKLARYAPDIELENVHLSVLDSGPDSPLYSTTINGSYVLLPKQDDWSGLEEVANNIFEADSQSSPVIEVTPELETARVEIQNGTAVSGLAFQASQMLTGTSFEVVSIGNADSKEYETTIIYDLSGGEKDAELAILKEFLEADVSMTASGWAFSDEVVPRELTVISDEDQIEDEEVDFLIILGQNAENLVLR